MHSGSGGGMHASDEYVEIDSVEKLAQIQIEFLKKIALAKGKEWIYKQLCGAGVAHQDRATVS